MSNARKTGPYFPSEDIITAQEYLEQTRDSEPGKRVQVINLCRSYKYLGHGYRSLLAEARGHKVIPSVRTISELTKKITLRPGAGRPR